MTFIAPKPKGACLQRYYGDDAEAVVEEEEWRRKRDSAKEEERGEEGRGVVIEILDHIPLMMYKVKDRQNSAYTITFFLLL